MPDRKSRSPSVKTIVKIILAANGIIFVAAVGLALWWDAPLPDDSDLRPPARSIPDSENGYLHFTGVHNSYNDTAISDISALSEMTRWKDDPAPWDAALAERILAHNAEILASLEAALARPDWQFPELALAAPWEELMVIHSASKLKRLEAQHFVNSGNPDAALASSVDNLHLGTACARADGYVLSLLVAATAYALGSDTLDFALHHPVSRAAVAARLDTTDTWQWHPEIAAGSFLNEYRWQRHLVSTHSRREIADISGIASGEPFSLTLYKPRLTLGYQANYTRELVSNLPLPYAKGTTPVADELADWPAKGFSWKRLHPNHTGRSLVATNVQQFERLVEEHFLRVFLSAKNQLLLALRLHEIDHGQLPAKLADLVPAYLPNIPPDPYTRDPLHYDPARRLLWSVGTDLTDAGGHPDASSSSEHSLEPTAAIPPLPE
ncbi:hypothetical protein BH23VER1_BH23VER1_32760 [soil metagenome]